MDKIQDQGPKPKKKKKKNNYFPIETEEAIIKYNNTTNTVERNRIYSKDIAYPVHKLTEYIYNTFKFTYFRDDPADVINECVSHLVQKMHKYNPESGKAFSYFSIIAKRYFIIKNNSNFEEFKRTSLISQTSGITQIASIDNSDQKNEYHEFVMLMIQYWEKNMFLYFKKRRDVEIANAVLELFRRVDQIDNYNKKALYIFIREMTGIDKTQYITKVVNRMKTKQTELLEEYLTSGDITMEEDELLFF